MSLLAGGFRFARPLLHRLDPETAHSLTIATLKHLPSHDDAAAYPRLQCGLFDMNFPNPLGLAAGFDKNGEAIDAMLGLGFGFVEVGTTTPLPQDGNPRPRLFRLAEDRAVINRFGFNNKGHRAMLHRLVRHKRHGIVGVNIGANKNSPDRIADYVAGIRSFGGIADYLTVNISSPNTPGLRGLQSRGELQGLLAQLNEERSKLAKPVPMLLKIAPDLGEGELADVAACVLGQVDGVIISNTTLSRPNLRSPLSREAGGLSGSPLFTLSTTKLAQFYLLTNGLIPLIGTGGISSIETAWAKICAGASLIQIYSALVYEGPELIGNILGGLNRKLSEAGWNHISQAVGTNAAEIAHHSGAGT